MSALTVLNAVVTALGSAHPVYVSDFLTVDEEGLLKLPDEPTQFVVTMITNVPVFEWAQTRYRTIRVQVDAWSRVEGEALAMIATAETNLVTAGFIPLDSRPLARDGAYMGAAQDFERTA